ncbi:ISLR2 [Branchiostoma lanceolatum]|uniref:ISLR2 protein n=1 Tax=Branchiostoma lanceolatum TaxID=7740 RepID=A0A8J9YTL9_BRALA|nr:ISLR2 [Branchiostoma lanceolatum]
MQCYHPFSVLLFLWPKMKLGLGGGSVVLLLLLCGLPWCAGWFGRRCKAGRWGHRPNRWHGFHQGDRGARRHCFRGHWGKRICLQHRIPRPTFPENLDPATAVFRAHESIQRFPVDLPNGTTSIDLNNNFITGLGNQSLSSLQDLQVLLLRHNMIAHIEPDAFRHVPKLQTLVLGGNLLTEFPWRHMQAQSLLTYLGLAGNRLTSLPNDTFRFLPALKELRIENNRLTSIPAGLFNNSPAPETVYMLKNPWNCDCEFLMSYKTLPPAITRLHLCMACASPQEHLGLLVSSLTTKCTEGLGETEATKNDSGDEKTAEKSTAMNPSGETVFPRKRFRPFCHPFRRCYGSGIYWRPPFTANDEQTKPTITETNKHASKPPQNQGQPAKRFENDGNARMRKTVKPATRPKPDTRRLVTDSAEAVFKPHSREGHRRFWGTPKPDDPPMGSQKTGPTANHHTDSPATRPMKRLNVKLPRTATFDTIHPNTIVIIVVLVALVGVAPLFVALLKIVRRKKPGPEASDVNEADNDEIQPYSTMFLSNIDLSSESPSTKRPKLATAYSNPADHRVVRHIYVDPDSTQPGSKAEQDGDKIDLKTSLNIRGPGDVYEDAVPVTFKTANTQDGDQQAEVNIQDGDHKAEVSIQDGDQIDVKTSLNIRGPEDVYEDAVPVTFKTANTQDGDQADLKTNSTLHDLEAGHVYEDAVQVMFMTGRFLAGETGELLDTPNKKPSACASPAYLKQATGSPQAQAADKLKQSGHITIAATPTGGPAGLTAIHEETDEYAEIWNYISVDQREKEEENREATGLGLKGGHHQWEVEANKDGRQPSKPNIYEKPEDVIAKLKLKT